MGVFWVLLGFIDFCPSKYRVLLGFISFLNEFWDVFYFCPFEVFLILALFRTRFYGVIWGFIRFYWVISLFLNDFGAIFKKTQKNHYWWVFLLVFFGFFRR